MKKKAPYPVEDYPTKEQCKTGIATAKQSIEEDELR
jgi:hypothetical protein